MKACSKCGLEKDDIDFPKYGNQCKNCKRDYNKKYHKTNNSKIKERRKFFYISNKDYLLDTQKLYYQENKQEILLYRAEYYQTNKKEMLAYQKKYRIDNMPNILARNNSYKRKKRKNDSSFGLRNDISRRILKTIQLNGGVKNGSSIFSYLSYSFQELKNHLEKQFEPWMTWKNRGIYNSKTWNDNDIVTWKWQIDHIVPQSSFPYSSMEEDNFQKCWALSNLRPLSAKQNVIENNKRIR